MHIRTVNGRRIPVFTSVDRPEPIYFRKNKHKGERGHYHFWAVIGFQKLRKRDRREATTYGMATFRVKTDASFVPDLEGLQRRYDYALVEARRYKLKQAEHILRTALMVVPADDMHIEGWQRRHHSDIAQRFEKAMRDGTL